MSDASKFAMKYQLRKLEKEAHDRDLENSKYVEGLGVEGTHDVLVQLRAETIALRNRMEEMHAERMDEEQRHHSEVCGMLMEIADSIRHSSNGMADGGESLISGLSGLTIKGSSGPSSYYGTSTITTGSQLYAAIMLHLIRIVSDNLSANEKYLHDAFPLELKTLSSTINRVLKANCITGTVSGSIPISKPSSNEFKIAVNVTCTSRPGATPVLTDDGLVTLMTRCSNIMSGVYIAIERIVKCASLIPPNKMYMLSCIGSPLIKGSKLNIIESTVVTNEVMYKKLSAMPAKKLDSFVAQVLEKNMSPMVALMSI